MLKSYLNLRKISSHQWFVWGILALALLLRIGGITHGVSFHPDERHIISVTERMLREGDFNPRFFAYGSLPFYLHGGLTLLLKPVWPWFGTYDGLFVVGRLLAVLFGVVAVALTYHLGRIVGGGRTTGFAAAALLALNVFHVQLSRFFTVDIVLTTIYVGAIIVFCRIARGGTVRDYIGAGILIGIAMATKISALSLLAPFLIAVGIERFRAGDWRAWRAYRFTVLTLLLIPLFLFIAAPYSFLDYQLFLQHSHEQISMTRGEWRPPYTVQYARTTPYIYPLEQMYRYTFGPLSALAVFLGVVWVAIRQVRRPSALELVLLAGILPVFFLVGGLQVKFPRYLLPLYPLLCVCGALGLRALGERFGSVTSSLGMSRILAWLPSTIVLLGALLTVAAFIGIYRQPHSYVTSSEWIFENVPAGARILGVHWDDKLPLSLPGRSPHEYRYRYEGVPHELAVYEPESPRKLEQMAAQLADHDFLVFPTARTYGSIPILPDEYSATTRLFSALFRGELGYGLVQSFKVRPALGTLVFNDDLADESFTVYDHPKVLIFKNIARLPAGEIARRIDVEGAEGPLVSRRDMLVRDSDEPPPARTAPSSLLAIILWLLTVELAALAVAPFLSALLRTAPDRGFGIAKVLGPFLLAFVVWLLAWYGGAPVSGTVAGGVLLCGLTGAHIFVSRRWGGWRSWGVALGPHPRTIEILFVAAFLLWAAVRACAPEIFWGEKPMDFTFLNFFNRLTTLPPTDPWVAGQPMGYYYLGFHILGVLLKVSGIDTAIGYNLGIALVAAWLVAVMYGLGVWVTSSRRGGLCVAFGGVLLSNWEVFRLAVFSDRRWNFDLFWASSRGLTSPAITEYPIWSILFADLHAHVIALPFVVTLMYLAFAPMKRSSDPTGRYGIAESALHGVVLGALFALNTWDFISGVGFTCIVIAIRFALADRGAGWLAGARDVLLDCCVIIGCAALVIIPFALSSVKAQQVHWGWVRGEFAAFSQVALHLGLWWLLLLLGTFSALIAAARRAVTIGGIGRFAVVIGAGSLPVAVAAAAAAAEIRGFSWVLAGVWGLLAAGASAVLVGLNERVERRLLGGLALSGIYLAVGAEFLFLMDRMNTIFKFYHFVWLALAVSSIGLMWGAGGGKRWMRRLGGLCALSGVGIAAFGSVVNLWAMVPFQRVDGPRPTLNGQAYLERFNPADAQLIGWLRRNVSGLPTVLEAHGDSYGPYTRIAMHTGLPTVLGWEHHVRQRGASDVDVQRRKRDIATMYLSTDIAQTLRLMKRYRISFVVVSSLERSTYPGPGLQKFEARPDFFEVVKRTAGGAVYRVILPPGGVIDGVR